MRKCCRKLPGDFHLKNLPEDGIQEFSFSRHWFLDMKVTIIDQFLLSVTFQTEIKQYIYKHSI